MTVDLENRTNVESQCVRVHALSRIVPSERLRNLLLFTICASLYLLPFMRIYMVGTDEGTLDQGAVRVFHGEVFTRDFFEVIGPGTFYLLAGIFKLFGVSFLVTRIWLFFESLATAILMYLLSRRVCRSYQALPPLMLTATCFGGTWPAISHHGDSNFFALLATAFLLLWYDKRNPFLLLVAGVFIGATAVILQPKGLLLFVASLVWFFVLHWREKISASSFGVISAGFLSVIGLVVLYFWSKGALRSLIYVNFVWPMVHYDTVNSVPYALDLGFTWSHRVMSGLKVLTVPVASVLIIPVLLVAAFPLLLPALGARFRWGLARADILLYWLCGVALWLAEIHRKDVIHLVYGSPFWMILCVYFLTKEERPPARYALQVIIITTVFLAFFNLSLLLVAHRVETGVGPVRIFKDVPLLSYLNQHVSPGEEIFVYPYDPSLYFLLSARNPTPYSILLYNFNTPEQFHDVVRILDQHKVRYVLWDQTPENPAEISFPKSRQLPAEGHIVEPYLETHYKVVQNFDGYRVLERIENSIPQ